MTNKKQTRPEHTLKSKIKLESVESFLPITLQHQYVSAEEVIGALSRELIMSGKRLTIKELELMLIVRLKLTSEHAQQDILRKALMLIMKVPLL